MLINWLTDSKSLLKSKISYSYILRRAKNATMSVLGPSNRRVQILKLFCMFKRVNKRAWKFVEIPRVRSRLESFATKKAAIG